jgi:23S rRNA pseudouridine2604 synthase
MNPNPVNSIRLNKAISDSGFCSRREADILIDRGKVTINGKVATLGDRVMPKDIIKVDNKPISRKVEKTVYLAFNKPKGITCTTDSKTKNNIVDFIKYPQRIFPIGRLDKDSEGLIFLTSDGDIVNKILRAGNQHEKEYFVTVNKPITPEFLKKMATGVPILDTITQKCVIKKEDAYVFRIILTQGLNRQIRRMCEYLGYEVLKLTRIRIMNITLENIPKGKWRVFTNEELKQIQKLVAESVKTEEASDLSNIEKPIKKIKK